MNPSELKSYEWSVGLEFDGIAECITKIAPSIDQAGDHAANQFAEMFSSGSYEDNIPAFEASRFSMWLANNRLPDLAYRGFLVAIWSALELEMIKLAKTFAEKTIKDQKALENELKVLRDVTKVEAFWKKNKVEMPQTWKVLDEIREVRNMIVHYNGDIRPSKGDLDKNDQKLNDRKDRVRKFIWDRIKTGIDNLSCPMDEIDISPAFCSELCNHCKTFLPEMAELVSNEIIAQT
ncbi:hypothetical protein [Schlesneria sp. T3-172]|uniref:hypothetical protein n=1 Tax=Schlesneria sphaerica TaxID=3373610 RepID=UPI0037C63880